MEITRADQASPYPVVRTRPGEVDEICAMDALALAERIRAREISPVEVVEAVLKRQEALDPTLHAFCTPTPDRARARARRLEAELSAGREVGPLSGVPIAVKDLICTSGVRTTGGSKIYAEFVPDENDIVVERLLAAGAIILGKTNVSEFGYGGVGHNPLFETTRNPWATHLTSGGSSAGSAVAVATGMAPVALGSDGGGSIRIPAAHCGVYGIKPSMGRVPLYPGCRDERYPGFSGWESIEHLGPLSRTVADSALVLSVIAGPDPRDRLSLPRGDVDWMRSVQGDITGLRVAYSADWGYAAVEPEVREIVAQAVEVFERELGCIVEVADPGWEDPSEAFMALVALESDLAGMRRLVDEHPGALSPHLADFVCRPWTAEDLSSAVMARKRIANIMWRFMCCYDLLLTPTLAVPPFAIDVQGPERIEGRIVATHQWSPFAFIMNMTGQPAASVPAGWTKAGLPVGLQIAGRHLDDALVLRASAAFEAATQPQKRWPPVVHACQEHRPASRK